MKQQTKKLNIFVLILFIIMIVSCLIACDKDGKIEEEDIYKISLVTSNVRVFNGDEELSISDTSSYENITRVEVGELGYVTLSISDKFFFTLGENSELGISLNEDDATIDLVKGELLYETKAENNLIIKVCGNVISPSISSSYISCIDGNYDIINLINGLSLSNSISLGEAESLNKSIEDSKLSVAINRYIEADISYADRLTSIGWYINEESLWKYIDDSETQTEIINADNLPNMEVTIGKTLKIYNKQIQYPTVDCSIRKKTTIWYKVGKDGKWGKDVPGFKDAGTYQIFIKVENPSYETYETSFKFTIEKAYQVVNIANLNNTFDKNSHSIKVDCGENEGTTFLYKKHNDLEFSTINPSFKDAGEYAIDVKITNPNYYDYETSVSLIIKKAEFIVNVSDINTTYDGNPKKINLTVNNLEGTSIYYRSKPEESWSTNELSYTNAGSYKVYYKIENPNYITYEGSSNITINKANMTLSANNINTQYDKSPHQVNVTCSESSGVDIQYKVGEGSWSKTAPSFKDVVSTIVYIKATKTNFKDCEIQCKVDITKGTLTGSISNIQTTFDKVAHYSNLTISDTDSTTIYYRTSVNDSWSKTNPKFTDAGNYIVYIKAENPNYNTYETSYTISISKADLTLTATDINTTYDKKAHKSVVTVSDTSGTTISYKVGNSSWTTDVPEFKNVISEVVLVKAENKNYNLKEVAYSVSISKANLTLTTTDIETTYNKKEHTSTVKVSDNDGTTISYKVGQDGAWSNTAPTFTNVIEETVYVKAENNNYYLAEGSYKVNIKKAKLAVIVENISQVYDGKDHEISMTINEKDGTSIYYRVNQEELWTSEKPNLKDVQNRTVYLKFENPNYNTVEKTVNVNITKGTLEVPTTIQDYYTGSAITVSIIPENITEGNTYYYRKGTSGSWSTTPPSYTKVGEYTGYVKITNPNCETYQGKYTFKISKPTMQTTAYIKKIEGVPTVICVADICGYEYEIGNCYLYDSTNKVAYATTLYQTSDLDKERMYEFIGPSIDSFGIGTYYFVVGLDSVSSKLTNTFAKYKLVISNIGVYVFSLNGSISTVSTYVDLINQYK